MRKEGISTCRQTVWRLERHIKTYGTIEPLPKSGRPTKITDSALMTIENAMSQDDETTAKELVIVLQTTGVSISKFTALKARHLLGWTSRGNAYCQSIRARNREKRLHWAQENLRMSFGVMKQQCRWKLIDDFVVVKLGRNRDIHPALSTLSRFLFGLELAGMEPLEPVFLMESWMPNFTVKFWMTTWYLLSEVCIRIAIGS